VASLRFNYDGEKRPERGRPIANENLARRSGFPYPGPFAMPPRPISQPIEVKTAPPPPGIDSAAASQPTAIVLPLEDPQEPQEETKSLDQVPSEQIPSTTAPADPLPQEPDPIFSEPVLSDSERFIASLENYENGAVKIRQYVDSSKYILDGILFQMDSFLKILDVFRENEERKSSQPQLTAAYEKTSKDTIDEVLELLQTPAMQNILRQVLMTILVKK